jgi:autotransporter-associated beta strand protein
MVTSSSLEALTLLRVASLARRVFEVGVGGQPALFGINGVISGSGANLVKSGNQPMVLNGLNTYTGTTTITPSGTLPSTGTTFSGLLVGNNVLPNTAGALGISNTPLLYSGAGTTGNSGGIGLSGQITFGRDIIIQNTTDTTNVSVFGNSIFTAKLTGGVSLLTGGTNRITQFQALNTGRLELLGPITGTGAVNVRFGDGANPAVRSGVVFLGGDANGLLPEHLLRIDLPRQRTRRHRCGCPLHWSC